MLRKIVVGLVLVLLVGLGAGYLWLRTTLPTISGSVTEGVLELPVPAAPGLEGICQKHGIVQSWLSGKRR